MKKKKKKQGPERPGRDWLAARVSATSVREERRSRDIMDVSCMYIDLRFGDMGVCDS